MRIQRNSLSRNSESKEVRFKTFIMMEGSETEPRYFECLFSKYRMTNSEVFFFAKEKNEIGWSNPLKLIDYIETKAVKEKLSSSYLSARNVLLDLFSQNSKNLDVRLFKTVI